ncbi:MAG: terminase large subunit [Elusimicrobia bacterium]|nr:terminase large subunit [Elusimicrobiota bacterium]
MDDSAKHRKPNCRKQRRLPGVSARLKALEKLLHDGRPRCALELAAIQRQISDLETGHRRGLVWDEAAAVRAVQFFSLLRHWKGRWAGKPITLEAWQEHCFIAPLFGWKNKDNQREKLLRRFRYAYKEVPRKNGKTTECAGVALQGLFADGEQGAEVYASATKRDQAMILFTDAKRCLGPELRALAREYRYSITFEQLSGCFKPLSSDHDSADGLNTSRAIVDELHAHKTRGMWDIITGSTDAREQPLVVAITTAGLDRNSIGWELHETARQVLEGPPDFRDDWFAFVAAAEDGDDWQSPETWRKANPMYGITVSEDGMRSKCQDAKASGSAEANFKRKQLNLWVSGVSTWIAPERWDECRIKPESVDETRRELQSLECFSGVDLGWRDDFAAHGRVFVDRVVVDPDKQPEPDEDFTRPGGARPMASARSRIRRAWVDGKVWIPENGSRDIHKPPLSNWIAKGLVIVTPGNSTDVDAIFADVMQTAGEFQLREVCIDPNNARQFGQELVAADIPTFEFFQSKRNYNEPCREFERLVAAGLLHHDGNELLRWMIANVVMDADARGYVMPAKHKSADKIDLPVSMLMAFARALFTETDPGSVYQEEGVFVL